MQRCRRSILALFLVLLIAACGGGDSPPPAAPAPLALAGTVSTLAGSGVSTFAGTPPAFYDPIGVVRVGDWLYVTDTGNHTVRKVDPATGESTVLAGAGVSGFVDGTGTEASLGGPRGIVSDGTNLYVSTEHAIRQIVIETGEVTTLAGSDMRGSADGTAGAARFSSPSGLWTDGTDLFVADTGNGRIRKVVLSTGVVTTVASGPDGIRAPVGIASTDGETFHLACADNTVKTLVASTRGVTTLAGGPFSPQVDRAADGTGSAARFANPYGIATDGTNLFVSDSRNHTIRKIVIATGVTTTLAGLPKTAGYADGTGSAARFDLPSGVFLDGSDLLVVDRLNFAVRRVATGTGAVTTVAGDPGFTADGAAGAATFENPTGVASDGTHLYVADTGNHAIRKIAIATGAVTTLAGSPGAIGSADGPGAEARFYEPRGIATDGTNLYVADSSNCTIRRVVIATGEVTTIAGTAGESGDIDATGSAATFANPWGIATDGTNLYVADQSNSTIRKVVIATGEVTTVAGASGVAGHANGIGAAATFDRPEGLAIDAANLYVADTFNCTIRKISLATGAVTTLAGYPGASGTEDGTGADARFLYPEGVVSDGTNLYVGDGNHTVRKVVLATGETTTVAGDAGFPGFANGSGDAAQFYFPVGLATDGTSLYVADCFNNVIRRLQ